MNQSFFGGYFNFWKVELGYHRDISDIVVVVLVGDVSH
jgi:hypothetical protein